MAGRHQEEREGGKLDIKARARGFIPLQRGLSLIKDGAAGQRSQSSWVEYCLERERERDCPVNEGCRFDPCRRVSTR